MVSEIRVLLGPIYTENDTRFQVQAENFWTGENKKSDRDPRGTCKNRGPGQPWFRTKSRNLNSGSIRTIPGQNFWRAISVSINSTLLYFDHFHIFDIFCTSTSLLRIIYFNSLRPFVKSGFL